jgi:hypothetical protein
VLAFKLKVKDAARLENYFNIEKCVEMLYPQIYCVRKQTVQSNCISNVIKASYCKQQISQPGNGLPETTYHS